MSAKRNLNLVPHRLATMVAVAFGLTTVSVAAQPQTDRNAQPPAPVAPATAGVTTPQPQAPRAEQPDMRVSQLLGADVRNAQGENLGVIQELMIDMDSRKVRHAVLSFGGVLGLGDKLFAYPISVFGVDRDNRTLILNVTRERLAESPGFDRDRYPSATDRTWWRRIDQAFGNGDERSAAAVQRLARASRLIDQDIELANGDDVGEVEDLVVNLRDREVKYVVMEFDREWNMNNRLVALPMDAFRQARDGDDLVVDRSREQLQSATAFDRNRWPDFSDGRYRQTVDRVTTAAPNVMTPPLMDLATFDRLDVNRDGQLTRDEVAGDAMLQRSFQQIDRNSSGFVTREQLEQFLAQQPQQDPSTANATSGQAAGTDAAPATRAREPQGRAGQ